MSKNRNGRPERPSSHTIKATRERLGYTQKQCADLVCSGLTTWQDWEAGKARMNACMWMAFQHLAGIKAMVFGKQGTGANAAMYNVVLVRELYQVHGTYKAVESRNGFLTFSQAQQVVALVNAVRGPQETSAFKQQANVRKDFKLFKARNVGKTCMDGAAGAIAVMQLAPIIGKGKTESTIETMARKEANEAAGKLVDEFMFRAMVGVECEPPEVTSEPTADGKGVKVKATQDARLRTHALGPTKNYACDSFPECGCVAMCSMHPERAS